MDTLLRFAGLIWLLSLTWAAVLVALEVRRDRRRAARLEIAQFPCDGPPLYWSTRMDTGREEPEAAPVGGPFEDEPDDLPC